MLALQHTALIICGICCSLGAMISGATVARHLIQTRHPSLKAYTIRILLMVPIYSLEAIGAILFYEWAIVLTVFRSCYEAFALLAFVQLMLTYLSMGCPSQGDGTRGAIWVALDMRGDPQVVHPFPLCCLPPWPMGPVFLRRCLVGVFQYTAVMPFVTIFTGLSTWSGVYGEGAINDWSSSYPYLALVQNVSQGWALYCLVLFYQATKARLASVEPLAKFLAIKVVVFFTWWQDLGIAALADWGAIQAKDVNGNPASVDEAANLLSNLIVCIEMLIMAQVFALAFPPSDYASSSATLSDKKGGAGSRYLLQPALGASLLNNVSLDGSINLSTSSHGASPAGNIFSPSRAQLHPATHYTPWLEGSDDNDEDDFMSGGMPDRRASSALHGVALSGIASDLARSFDFWDVLRDMRTMAQIGKVPGDLGYIAEDEEGAGDGKNGPRRAYAPGDPSTPSPTFLERLLGRRRAPLQPTRGATPSAPVSAAPYAPPSAVDVGHREDSLPHSSTEESGSRCGAEGAGTATALYVGAPRERAGSGPMFGCVTSDEWGEESINFEV